MLNSELYARGLHAGAQNTHVKMEADLNSLPNSLQKRRTLIIIVILQPTIGSTSNTLPGLRGREGPTKRVMFPTRVCRE